MTLLNITVGRPANEENETVFNAVEDYIENNPNLNYDSYTISQELDMDRKTVNKALSRLAKHKVITPIRDDDGNTMTLHTGTRGRPPVQYRLSADAVADDSTDEAEESEE